MSKLARILEKAGLIESEYPEDAPGSDTESLPAPTWEALPLATEAGAGSPTSPDSSPEQDYLIPEGISADSIYKDAAIPACTYSVERLAKLVDGLKQLDAATQRAAIMAMDAADDTWAIEDIVEDAKKKIEALRQYAERTTGRVRQIQARIDGDIQRLSGDKDKSVKEIQAQIADLQQLLEATGSRHAAEIAKLNSQAASAQQAGDRERQRVSEQAKKITALIQPFVTASNI